MSSSAVVNVCRPEPRWPAILAASAAVALHFALPPALRFGPPWTIATIVAIGIIAASITRKRGMQRANDILGYSILSVLTAGLLWGVGSLIFGLVVSQGVRATDILRAAAVLWTTNVLVFASWYWRIDAGGPNAREQRGAHTEGAFLFPQMTVTTSSGTSTIAEEKGWTPHFVDYLFIAFNTSTAFSPTDAPVLSKLAKVAMMIQAIISFTTVVLIAARAVNVLPML
ncbi:MAG: hypothetical protein ABJE10_05900 [bacterium]